MKPLIGLNLDINFQKPTEARIARSYYEAIELAGGIPVLIPPMPDASLKRLLKQLDGLVFIGGRDYFPELYGKTTSDLVNPLNADRQEFDLRLARIALKMKKLPMLFICGGLQLLAIALGGSLIVDIHAHFVANHLVHKGEGGELATHAAFIKPGSQLFRIFRKRFIDRVVSSHHQCVDDPGVGAQVAAWSSDGIIEAVELPGYAFAIGVQWHPERDFATNRRLLRAFIAASRRRNENR